MGRGLTAGSQWADSAMRAPAKPSASISMRRSRTPEREAGKFQEKPALDALASMAAQSARGGAFDADACTRGARTATPSCSAHGSRGLGAAISWEQLKRFVVRPSPLLRKVEVTHASKPLLLRQLTS